MSGGSLLGVLLRLVFSLGIVLALSAALTTLAGAGLGWYASRRGRPTSGIRSSQ